MNEGRAKELLCYVLAQISDHIEWKSQEEYVSWLKTEVGFSEGELQNMSQDGLLPISIVEKEPER